ncbi:MAG: hypothetical protein P9F75_00955 [Candidatus Contendobacter sp.]|nr:hypothetical protein [Candidatus Contendobacter sp.]
MSYWQMSVVVTVGALALLALAGWLILRHVQRRERLIAEAALAAQQAAEKAAAEKAAAERATLKQLAAERLAARRAMLEQAALERAAQDKAVVEQAIAEWAAAEQAEAERVQLRQAAIERREAEEAETRLRAVEEAITEWVEAERKGSRLAAPPPPGGKGPPRKVYTRAEVIHQQVRLQAEAVTKEIQELEYIKNRIEAGVDLLPIEFKQTVDEWKEGRVLRHSSFDDLKLKFRYKAYSVEDGYELLYLYSRWVAQQWQKLRVFVRLLGTEVDLSESIQAAIERAERKEREKYLEMDMDVLLTLRDIRDIVDKLIGMETLLKELEVVCQRRSDQIIAPKWEAKGLL